MQVLPNVLPLLIFGGFTLAITMVIVFGKCYVAYLICSTRSLSDKKAKWISKMMSTDSINFPIKRTDN